MRLNYLPEEHQVRKKYKKSNLKIKVWILFLLFVITLVVIYGILIDNYFDIHSQSNVYIDVDKKIVNENNSNIEISTLENRKRILSDVQINTWNASDQSNPKVSSLSDGNFVVVWQSYLQNDSSWDIYAQIFYNNGEKNGCEFHISNSTAFNQTNPNIAASSNGKFMVV